MRKNLVMCEGSYALVVSLWPIYVHSACQRLVPLFEVSFCQTWN